MKLENASAVGEQALDQSVATQLVLLNFKMEILIEAIGKKNDKGDGGTGLVGELARTNARLDDTNERVDHLYSLRNIGIGMFMAIGALSVVIIAGIKGLLLGWFPTTPPQSGG